MAQLLKLQPPRPASGAQILFVTATDTGVGKTLFTISLLHHLRRRGVEALAVKPFCSGGHEDVERICAIQGPRLRLDEVNPFYFPEPLTPLVAARRQRRRIGLAEVLAWLERVRVKCDRLIVEGCGGLLAPLGEGYTAADLVANLACRVVVVAPNRLGTLNHILLTIRTLQSAGQTAIDLVLMGQQKPDLAARTNPRILREWLAPVPVYRWPFLGPRALSRAALERNEKKLKKVLAPLAGSDIFHPAR